MSSKWCMPCVIGVLVGSVCGCGGPLVGGGSGDTDGEMPSQDGGDEIARAIQLTVNHDVDILFVVDNSGSMGEEQGLLSRGIGAFLEVLEAEDVGANYRIGVTTTDNGNPACTSSSPEAGKLQMSSCLGRTGEFVFNGNPPSDATTTCTDSCIHDTITTIPTTTALDTEAKPRPWLERDGGQSNLAAVGGVVPTTADAFKCFAPQGIAGCGFESHLESMYKTMLRSQREQEQEYGFVRSNAILSVVIVTDELDCSYVDEFASIFSDAQSGGNQVFWSDPEATSPSSAVCFNAGVVCTGGPGIYDECHASNKSVDGVVDVADIQAVLHPVHRYVDFVQELEDEKQQITPDQEVLVSLIAGVPAGYDQGQAELTYADATGQEALDFGIGAGCVNSQTDPATTARPPVREREFAEEFQVGETRSLYSVCADDFSPALVGIANAIRDQIKPACVPACVADGDPVSAGLQPSCTLVQETPRPDGSAPSELSIEPCNGAELPAGQDVCYVALVDAAGENATPSQIDEMSGFCSDAGWNLEFRLVRTPGPVPGGISVSVDCELSRSKQQDCPGLP